MTYFVTGATGFIGRRLVKKLLARRGTVVYFLVRAESRDKVPALLEDWGVGEERAIPVVGDLGAAAARRLEGRPEEALRARSSTSSTSPPSTT